jgi:hypothetical protein
MQSNVSIDKLRRVFIDGLRNLTPETAYGQRSDGRDTNYEDTLLEVRLRNYFRTEYGMAQPPSGVLPRLLATVRAHERGAATKAARPLSAVLNLCRVLRTTAAHPLVSGGVAAAITISIVTSGSYPILHSTGSSLAGERSTPTSAPVLIGDEALKLATDRDNRYLTYRPPGASDAAFYDPVELRLPPRTGAASGYTNPYRWQRFGGQ